MKYLSKVKMATEETTATFSKRILTKDDLEKLPEEIRNKYEEFFSEFMEMKALYETQRSNLGESKSFSETPQRKISKISRSSRIETQNCVACLVDEKLLEKAATMASFIFY